MGGEEATVQGERLLLDRKGICFLCLQETGKGRSEDDKEEEVSLRNICRYLEIRPSSVVDRRRDESRFGEEEEMEETWRRMDKCGISVMLCGKCAAMTKYLSDLILQKEMIEMMVKHELQCFREILMEPETDDALTRSGGNCDEKSRMMNQLRQLTKQKCSDKVKSLVKASLPKVQLLKVDRQRDRQRSSSVSNFNTTTACVLPPPHSGTAAASENSDLAMNNSCHSSTKEVISSMCSNYSEKLKRTKLNVTEYKCPYCCKFLQQAWYRRHLVNVHPEKVLIFMKLPQIPETVFRRYCRSILKSETMKALQKQGSRQVPEITCSSCVCSYCGHKASTNTCEFKYHLVMEHEDVLEDKLKRLQELGMVDEINSLTSLQVKTVQSIPKNRLKSGGPETAQFNMKRYSKLKRLAVRRIAKVRFRRMKSGQASVFDENFESEDEIEPVIPVNISSNATTSNNLHVPVLPHSSNGPNSDYEAQVSNQSTTEPSEEIYFAKELLSEICTNYSEKPKQGCHYKCHYCHKFFRQALYRRHLVNVHPEKFLAPAKIPQVSEMAFKHYCKRVLKSETSQKEKKQSLRSLTMKGFTCNCCNRDLGNLYEIKYHLVLEHFGYLNGKLNKLQQLGLRGTRKGNRRGDPIARNYAEEEDEATNVASSVSEPLSIDSTSILHDNLQESISGTTVQNTLDKEESDIFCVKMEYNNKSSAHSTVSTSEDDDEGNENHVNLNRLMTNSYESAMEDDIAACLNVFTQPMYI